MLICNGNISGGFFQIQRCSKTFSTSNSRPKAVNSNEKIFFFSIRSFVRMSVTKSNNSPMIVMNHRLKAPMLHDRDIFSIFCFWSLRTQSIKISFSGELI